MKLFVLYKSHYDDTFVPEYDDIVGIFSSQELAVQASGLPSTLFYVPVWETSAGQKFTNKGWLETDMNDEMEWYKIHPFELDSQKDLSEHEELFS